MASAHCESDKSALPCVLLARGSVIACAVTRGAAENFNVIPLGECDSGLRFVFALFGTPRGVDRNVRNDRW